ncbi:hypothetical protein Y032_0101g3331 [Ancylostoma ceylanicum]|uniref:Uncharacterized protein n=1 Tax=Ancylostoma ceylanicum TaxID=53326 RepID=A0A016TGR8_9BILA|nr:hypothetical protein Y032_0101g3331 [Ancylostoma ceylanicum]
MALRLIAGVLQGACDDCSIASDDSVTMFDGTPNSASGEEAGVQIINPSQGISCGTRLGAKVESNRKRRREDEVLDTVGTIAKQPSTPNPDVSLTPGDEWDLPVRLRELAQYPNPKRTDVAWRWTKSC